MKGKGRILIVDDASFMRRLIREQLEAEGYQIIGEAETSKEAVIKYFKLKPDVVVMDLVLERSGSDVAYEGLIASKQILSKDSTALIIAINFNRDQEVLDAVAEIGIKEFVLKPFQPAHLWTKVDALIEEYGLRSDQPEVPVLSDEEIELIEAEQQEDSAPVEKEPQKSEEFDEDAFELEYESDRADAMESVGAASTSSEQVQDDASKADLVMLIEDLRRQLAKEDNARERTKKKNLIKKLESGEMTLDEYYTKFEFDILNPLKDIMGKDSELIIDDFEFAESEYEFEDDSRKSAFKLFKNKFFGGN